MSFVYVYSPSDFVSLPDENGGAADGSPTFTLTLVPGATPTLVEISDDDLVFDEIDTTQTLTAAVTIDGTPYTAGTSVHTAYDLVDSGSGHRVSALHFGGDGTEQGAVHGIVSTVPMIAGQSYTFDTERDSDTQSNQYSDFVACFAEGTLIETEDGYVRVEDLHEGSCVLTMDNGVQPIRWIGRRTVQAVGAMAPVVISAGTVGNTRNLVVSPEHRILVGGAKVEYHFGQDEVLVAAKFLCDGDRIYRRPGHEVTYYHFMFDSHQIVFAEGVPAESFLPGEASIGSFGAGAREELRKLFPELFRFGADVIEPARMMLRSFEAKVLRLQ